MQELNDALTSLRHWLEVLQLCGIGAAFGLVGGLVRVLRRGLRGWLDLLSQCVVSAFCGLVAFSLVHGQVSDMALVALAGIAGNSGGMLLDALRWRLIQRIIGLPVKPPKELTAEVPAAAAEPETAAPPKDRA